MRWLGLVWFLWAGTLAAQSIYPTQDRHVYDSTYYDKLPDALTLKLLSFTKYSDFNLSDGELHKILNYEAHPGPSLGLGMHYKWLGLTFSMGYNAPGDTLYQRSRRFDFQTHLFLRKLTLQFYSSAYSGYYLNEPEKYIRNWTEEKPYPRSDIKTHNFGFNGFYLFNSGRFSNRAPSIYNEWQKKSAGSLVVGATLLYNQVKADSAIIPPNLLAVGYFNDTNFTFSEQFTLGGQVGYAFTLVLRQYFFVNFSILGGISAGRTNMSLTDGVSIKETRLNVVMNNSAGFGYNSKRFYAGFNYTNLVSNAPTPVQNTSIDYHAGKFQLVVAYRFTIPEHPSILPAWLPFEL